MGRRIVQLVCLMLTAGLVVPLALALAEAPTPAPATPDRAAAEGDLGPAEATAPAGAPALPAPPEKDLLQDALKGSAPLAAPRPPVVSLPGPRSRTLPAAAPPRPAAPGGNAASAAVDGPGERPDPPAAEQPPALPAESAVRPLPRTPPSSGADDEPARSPIRGADVGERPAPDPAARDGALRQSQGLAEPNPLPPAVNRPGKPGPATVAPPPSAEGLESFVLPAEQLPLGQQAVGLTVDVVSPKFLNLNQETTLKVVVKNSGSTDAKGVVVRDALPDGLEFRNSQPDAQNAAGSRLYVWHLGTIGAGAERTILLRAVPTRVGAFEHAVTVTMQAGAKARTFVREPRLKVEQLVSSVKVLKGEPLEWRVFVTNTGDGPATGVKVRAKLTDGLRHESGEPNDENLFEQELERLEPGQRVALDPLVTDTVLPGVQSCTVDASSPDVSTALDDARSTVSVTVTEPKLELTVAGPDKRFTDSIARYDLTLRNGGTATARKIRVLANLPVGGNRLVNIPPGAQFDRTARKLVWTLPQLDRDESKTFSLQIKMESVGSYQVAVEARADGGLHDEKIKTTLVEGYADLDLEVTEKRRIVDAGDTAVFRIRVANRGTKEATHVLASGYLSKNLLAKDVDIENNGQVGYSPETGQVSFPAIDRLGPGKETVINVRVQALPRPGLATFRVELVHDDLKEGKLEDIGSFRITSARTADK